MLILELIGVVVARHGLILGQNGATPSRKLSRCLPPPFHIIFVLKTEFLLLTDRGEALYYERFYLLSWRSSVGRAADL